MGELKNFLVMDASLLQLVAKDGSGYIYDHRSCRIGSSRVIQGSRNHSSITWSVPGYEKEPVDWLSRNVSEQAAEISGVSIPLTLGIFAGPTCRTSVELSPIIPHGGLPRVKACQSALLGAPLPGPEV